VHWEIKHSRFPVSQRIKLLKSIRLKFRRAAAKAQREAESTPEQRR